MKKKDCEIKGKPTNKYCINCKANEHSAAWYGCPGIPKIKTKNDEEKISYSEKLKKNIPEHKIIDSNHPNTEKPNSPDQTLPVNNEELIELLNAMKIVKEAIKEFPNLLEIAKKLSNTNNKQDKLKLLLELI